MFMHQTVTILTCFIPFTSYIELLLMYATGTGMCCLGHMPMY